jgi:hypothetical protein
MTRAGRRALAAVLTALIGSVAMLYADDARQHSRIDRVHASYVQACRMTLDEDEAECEGRWMKALTP